jgi:glyceraldehyde 3-phosphate dehydrogenase
MVEIAINGFGRIGRNILRAALEKGDFPKNFEIVAINDLTDAKTTAMLLKYDSVQGVLKDVDIKYDENSITVNGNKIKILKEKELANLKWKDLGVDLVLECTGFYADGKLAAQHIANGAKKVIISAPATNQDATIVLGVNDEIYDAKKHNIVSMGSCTTNSLAPVAKVLDEKFKILKGTMTTIHAYTNDQRILDLPHKDLRRARAAAVSTIPTTTGAAKAISEVLPNLKGKLDGLSLRVPVPDGSINDLTVLVEKDTSVEEVNAAVKKASQGSRMKGILQYSEEPLVSHDIIGNPYSSIFDAELTKVVSKNLVKTLAWYDNEWGFSNRMVELALMMGKKL